MGLAALPAAARAQPPADPIGALLDHPDAPLSRDQDEPDVAGQKIAPDPDPSPVRIPPSVPAGPIPYAPPPGPRLTAPVPLEETGKTPDGPPGVRDLAYDSRLRASFASAEQFQGPLDGGWTLEAGRGGALYALQLVDRRDRLEGVWRDLTRPGALGASGLVDDIQRSGSDLTLRFTVRDTLQSVVTLHDGGDGRWSGRLTRGDEVFDVALRRTGP